MVAVYGPRAVPPRREQADRAVVEVAVTPATATRGPALRSTSSCVASAVRAVLLVGLHPRTGVTVALQARCTAGWEARRAHAPRPRSRCAKTARRWRRLSTPRWLLPWTHAFRWQGCLVRAQCAPACFVVERAHPPAVQPAAVTVAVLPGGAMLVDPTALEEQVSGWLPRLH